MSKQVTLFCEETPGLKLGPGNTSTILDLPAGNVIVFVDGFATFDPAEFPDWERWSKASGTPHIRVVDESSGEATTADEGVPCPICGKTFKSDFGLNGHLRSHAPKAA